MPVGNLCGYRDWAEHDGSEIGDEVGVLVEQGDRLLEGLMAEVSKDEGGRSMLCGCSPDRGEFVGRGETIDAMPGMDHDRDTPLGCCVEHSPEARVIRLVAADRAVQLQDACTGIDGVLEVGCRVGVVRVDGAAGDDGHRVVGERIGDREHRGIELAGHAGLVGVRQVPHHRDAVDLVPVEHGAMVEWVVKVGNTVLGKEPADRRSQSIGKQVGVAVDGHWPS